MDNIKHYLDIEDLKTVLKILTKEKGINLYFLCNEANVNYSLIRKLNTGTVKDIGADKKKALIETIKVLYL